MARPPEGDAEHLLGGRYRVGECIGEGGMARVHRGEDILLGRTVAIKLIRPGIDGVGTPERVRGEVSALASLSHPSLVTLFDAHLDEGETEYLVMEFVDGPPLSHRMDGGPLPREDVAQLAAELAEALHVVHAAGIVHRDVKPSNVLLYRSHLPGRPFRAKLADFGIARLLDDTRVTDTGQVVGTAAYLAPEQVRGAAPAPPADVYALGLVLLEALTGCRAYPHAEGIGTALARLSAPPELPVSLGPRWTSLLARMTAIDPDMRPAALEVAVAAGDILAGSGVPSVSGSVATAAHTMTATAPFPLPAPVEPTLAETVPPPLPTTPPEVAAASAATGTASGPLRSRARRVRRRRRLPIALMTAATVLIVVVGVWAVGALGAPGGGTSPIPPVTESTPDPAPADETIVDPGDGATVDVAVDEAPLTDEIGVEDPGGQPAGVNPAQQNSDEKAQKAAEKEAERAARDAEKAQRDADKAAEKAQKDAEKAAERAGR
ncbi:serine/threonine-protein kinase [Microbacterium telephonicum]|uniref:non-specific serine/threonine protein kinase n=1 Tax=Microbacterium telephonicum TaxID=1714841 RepID=A0A498C4D1_9MICO|nr:serine/threonine-protein kinase [Microbacterium telephonicum]RLK47668.1 serine/threonine protein kinase [Microbacterium telephonicum]